MRWKWLYPQMIEGGAAGWIEPGLWYAIFHAGAYKCQRGNAARITANPYDVRLFAKV